MNSGETKTYDSRYTSILARENGPRMTDSSVVYTRKSINYNIFALKLQLIPTPAHFRGPNENVRSIKPQVLLMSFATNLQCDFATHMGLSGPSKAGSGLG
jgi:hypothetical protein